MIPESRERPEPLRVPIGHLRPDQVQLLRALLRGGDVPVAVVGGELVTGPQYADDVREAMEWVLATHEPPPDEIDPELTSGRGPLVTPSRPPLADGRRQATRWRRFAEGAIDEVLISVPILLAALAGAPAWTLIVITAVYRAAPVALYGWTVGKLWCGVRVVDRRRLRTPDPLRAGLRWFVATVPLMIGLITGITSDPLTLLALAVYAPILIDLRGLHDRAAGTLVVERDVAR